MSANKEITKDNLDNLLFQVAKEYRKLNGKKMRQQLKIPCYSLRKNIPMY